MSTLTLNAREVLKLKKIDSDPVKDKNGLDYWKFAKGSTVFIARKDFTEAWAAGNIFELDLEEAEEKAEDGTTIKRLQVGGFITNKQMIGVATAEAQIKFVEKKLAKEFSLENMAETA